MALFLLLFKNTIKRRIVISSFDIEHNDRVIGATHRFVTHVSNFFLKSNFIKPNGHGERMKLIIFDCDGTLVDSEFLCNLAMQQQLAAMGFSVNAQQLTDEYRGVSLSAIMSSLETKLNTVFPPQFETEYRAKVETLFDQHLKPIAGVVELIESLTIPFCIASSGPRKKIQHALAVTGLDKYFKGAIFSAHEVGVWKPDPGLFLHAAKTMQVAPKDCYVVEDSAVGVQAAHRANMRCVYYAPETTEKNPLATLQVRHMSELKGQLV